MKQHGYFEGKKRDEKTQLKLTDILFFIFIAIVGLFALAGWLGMVLFN